MDINSVKQAIEWSKKFRENFKDGVSKVEELKIANDMLVQFETLASLVVNAPVAEDKDTLFRDVNKRSKAFAWNARGEADRILWAKVMARLPEIIKEYAKKRVGKVVLYDELSDAIKKELGVKG